MAKTTKKNSEKVSFLTKISSEEQDFEHMRPFLECGNEYILWVVGIMKKNRKRATNSETCLGKYLYKRRIIFISQAPFIFRVGGKNKLYFADFYIPATKTVIEVDGHSHDTPESIVYDEMRDRMFESIGIKTIRIKSILVFRGEFKDMIPIPEEKYLRPEKLHVIPEGQGFSKEKLLRSALHKGNGKRR